MKGADTVMAGMVQYNDWLEEECSNMAREGKVHFIFSIAATYGCEKISSQRHFFMDGFKDCEHW